MLPGSQKPMSAKLAKCMLDPATGCWNWQGSTDKDGYGRILAMKFGVRIFMFAHRASFIHHVRPLRNNELVCHHCDNPGCINPAHLYAGPPATNGADKRARPRKFRILKR
jgi:hypothetical protein